MAVYRVAIYPQSRSHIYEKGIRTLHITIGDIFTGEVEFGSWCEDDIYVSNMDTKVSVRFRPWHNESDQRAVFRGTYGDKVLYLDVWKDIATRDRALRGIKGTNPR